MNKKDTTELKPFLEAVEKYSELSSGYAIRFPANTNIIKQVSSFISRERLRHPTLKFNLEVISSDATWLTLKGTMKDKEYLKENIISQLNHNEYSGGNFLSKYFDFFNNRYARLGFWGTVAAVVCCIIPAIIGALTATSIAAYFIYLDYILFPIFIASVIVFVLGYKQYHNDNGTTDNTDSCNC